MSLRAMLWALYEAPVSNPTEAFVLVALADNAHDDGTHAFPSVKSIAERCRTSERSVQRALRALEGAGVIHSGDQSLAASYGRYAPKVYELVLTRTRGDNLSPLKSTARGDNLTPLRGDAVSPKPVLKPKQSKNHLGGVTHQGAVSAKPTPKKISETNDEFGPLKPRCPKHFNATDDPPCWDCAAIRPEFEVAQVKRNNQIERDKATTKRARRTQAEAGIAASAERISQLRAAARGGAWEAALPRKGVSDLLGDAGAQSGAKRA